MHTNIMPTLSTSPPPPPKHIQVYIGPSGSGKSTAIHSFIYQQFEGRQVTFADDEALSSLWQNYHNEEVIYIENMDSCLRNNPHLTPQNVLEWLNQFNANTVAITGQHIRASHILMTSYSHPFHWWPHVAVDDDNVKAIVELLDIHHVTR